jgi:AraC-like DNA-binding protein
MYRDDGGVITWRRAGGGEDRCAILGSGVYPATSAATFLHPGPAFTRLFHFEHGSAQVLMGRRALTLDAGPTWLLPTGRSFRITYAAGTRFHFFHLRWLDQLGRDVFAGLGQPSGQDLGPLAGLLCAAHGRDGAGDRRRWQPLLFAALVGFLPGGPPPRQDCERHRELIAHVHRHAGNGLSVAALARRQGLSPAALSKRFRRDTGMGLKRWLLDTAMERARELLATGGQPVQAVAAQLGYTDPFHFQRVFKRCTGLTPSSFRRALRLGLADG